MRYVVVIVILCLFSGATKYRHQEEIITWNEDRPLTWSDFRGKPEHRNSIASTHYNLIKKIIPQHNSATVKITAVFYPESSWKRRRKKGVLMHEQKHFDIVELYARKLRKKIRSETFSDLNDLETKVDEMYKLIDKELDLYQDRYDAATNHSRNSRRQAKWNSRVLIELDNYSAFKDNSIEIKFQETATR